MKKEKIVIYQLLPRLFGNTTENCVAGGSLEENGVGKFNDINDNALTAIKRLGCTHVWYTGILEHATQTDYSAYGIAPDNCYVVKGKAGSPYAVKDYYDVDPDLAVNVAARMSEFESLVARTHENGLRVVIDFVPNHVARQYRSDAKPAGVHDLGENDNRRHHFDTANNFYYFPDETFSPRFFIGEGQERYIESPAKATGNDCFCAAPSVNDWYETVKLNYGVDYLGGRTAHFDPVPDTWTKMLHILLFWAAKGIDAFRCDMAEMVPVEFWHWVIPQVKKTFPEILFIAEVYNPNEYRNYLQNGRFDYLYDKVGLYDLLREVVGCRAPAAGITGCWQSLDGIGDRMVNFLENHDEQRVASSFNAGDPFKAYPALVVSALMNTNPFLLYFGQELGERGEDAEGFSGHDGRTTIFDYWSVPSVREWYNGGKCNTARLSADRKKLREMYRKVLTLCNREAAVREGGFFDLMYVNGASGAFDPQRQYAFARRCKNDLLLVAVNFGASPVQAGIRLPQHLFDFWHIRTGAVSCKELLGGAEQQKNLSPDTLFDTPIAAYGAVVWKCRIMSE